MRLGCTLVKLRRLTMKMQITNGEQKLAEFTVILLNYFKLDRCKSGSS